MADRRHDGWVVVGVDGSFSAARAARWAARQAQRLRAGLRLVHAYEVPLGYPPGVADPHVLRVALREQGARMLADAQDAATTAAPGLHVQTMMEHAPSVPVLVKESRRAVLLVLGSRGLGRMSGALVGSTAVAVAAHSLCPMVVVRGPVEDGEDTEPDDGPVVVGVDGTPASERAIGYAFAEASSRGCPLIAVHAWSENVFSGLDIAGPTGRVLDLEPFHQQAVELLAERLAGWQEKYPDVSVVREVVRDRTSRALLRYATGAQLMVVGTRGRGGFRGLLLGSTSQQLIWHAPCPVAVVRSEPSERPEE